MNCHGKSGSQKFKQAVIVVIQARDVVPWAGRMDMENSAFIP